MDSRKKRDVETMRAAMGVLPQGLRIDPGYRCEDFLAYAAWLKRIPASQSRRRVVEALGAVGLGIRRASRSRNYPGDASATRVGPSYLEPAESSSS